METRITRRGIMQAAGAAALAAVGRTARSAAPEPSAKKPRLCLFSKHIPVTNDYARLAAAVREQGFDAVDLTVRPKGHVLPESAVERLPRAVKALRDGGVEVGLITTGLLNASDPSAEPIISTAGKAGVHFFKTGYYRYRNLSHLRSEIRECSTQLRSLAELGGRSGIALGYHNHSGENNVGAAVWDAFEMLKDIDPKWAGLYFDPCHATTEGGLSGWDINFHLVAPRVKMVAVKDFYWEKRGGQWRQTFCPLGEGMVPFRQFFAALAKTPFDGPISLHIEYEPKDPVSAVRRDLEFLKARVSEAYA